MGNLINAPKESEDDLDVYAKKKKDHNTMAHMYKEIPDAALETHKFGSIHYLLSGLRTINWILRHTLLPKSGDHKMIRGHAPQIQELINSKMGTGKYQLDPQAHSLAKVR